MVSATLRWRGSPRKRGRCEHVDAGVEPVRRSRRCSSSGRGRRRSRWRAADRRAGDTARQRRAGRRRRRRRPPPGRARGTAAPTGTTMGRSRRSARRVGPGAPPIRRGVRAVSGWWRGSSAAGRRRGSAPASDAAASSRCSQLSTTRSMGRSAGELSRASKESKPELRGEGAGHAGLVVDAGEVDVPDAHREASPRPVGAAARARTVLPTPPGPMTVTSRLARNRSSSSRSSRSRPMSALDAIVAL